MSKMVLRFNMSEEEVETFIRGFKEAFKPTGLKWTFQNSMYCVIQMVTTIGKVEKSACRT